MDRTTIVEPRPHPAYSSEAVDYCRESASLVNATAAATLLHQYSEWLDAEGSVDPSDTCDDLVKRFLAQRDPMAHPKVI